MYRRKGDCASTAKVAARHDRLLAKVGLDAAVTRSSTKPTVAKATFSVASAKPTATRKLSITGRSQTTSASLPSATPPSRNSALDAKRPKVNGSELGAAINSHVKGLRQRGNVSRDEKTSWLVYDLGADQMVAEINGSTPRQCASMVKPFVMLAMFHEVEAGRLRYGPKLRGWTEQMIQRSDNAATNRIMKFMGGPAKVQRILDRKHGDLFAELSIVEYIAAGGRTYKNSASARDHARFLRSLWHGEFPRSREMQRIMKLPGRDRLRSNVASFPRGTSVMNKTGTTARLIGDMGIITVPDGNGRQLSYIIVGLIEKDRRARGFRRWSSERANVIRSVSELSLQHMRRTSG